VGQRIRVMQLLGVCPKRSLSCNGVEDNQIEIFSTPAKNFNRLGCILFFTILEMPASIDTLSKSFRWLLYATVCIVGFLATFNNIAFRSFLEKNNKLLWINSFDPISLYLHRLGLSGMFNWTDLLFVVMLLTGSWLFHKRNADYSGLLRFGLGILCIHSFAGLVHALGYHQMINQLRASGEITEAQLANTSAWIRLLPTVFDVALILVTLVLVHKLNAAVLQRRADSAYDSKATQTWRQVPTNTRIIHYLVDNAIIIMSLFPLGRGVMMMLGKTGFRSDFNRLELSLLYVGCMFIYYTFFELLFRSTPAKFLSGTYVVNDDRQEIARYNRIMGRIVGRFIPLEPFTFLFGHGWHDTISQTTVARRTPSSFRYGLNMWWFVLFLLVIAVPPIVDKINEGRNNRVERDLRDQARAAARDLKLKHLGKGYIIHVQNQIQYSERLLLLVSDQRGDSLEITVYLPDTDQQGSKGWLSGWSPADRPPFVAHKNGFLQRSGHDIVINNRSLGKDEFEVEDIHVAGFPLISPGNSYGSNGKDGIFRNHKSMVLSGQSCTITKLVTTEGDAVWQNKLPQVINIDSSFLETGFELYYHSHKKDKPIKATMTVQGPDGKSYEYWLSLARNTVIVELSE
jgi:hypothetical protein